VFVTHDQDEALALADLVAVINQGKLEQIGTPDQIRNTPASQFVRDFLGQPATTHPLPVADNGKVVRIH